MLKSVARCVLKHTRRLIECYYSLADLIWSGGPLKLCKACDKLFSAKCFINLLFKISINGANSCTPTHTRHKNNMLWAVNCEMNTSAIGIILQLCTLQNDCRVREGNLGRGAHLWEAAGRARWQGWLSRPMRQIRGAQRPAICGDFCV